MTFIYNECTSADAAAGAGARPYLLSVLSPSALAIGPGAAFRSIEKGSAGLFRDGSLDLVPLRCSAIFYYLQFLMSFFQNPELISMI